MLWGTQTVSNIADIVYTLSLVTLVFTASGSLLTTIFIPLFRMLSKMVSGFVAPLIMSRIRLTSILIGSQLGQFVIFTGLIFYLWLSPEVSYPIIFLTVFGMSFLDGWTDPARNALIPRLAEDEGLMKANGLMSVSDQVVKCSGWALSGVIVAVIGAVPTMWIASVSYFLAMFFTAFIRDPYAAAEMGNVDASPEASGTEAAPRKPSYGEQLSEGWKILATNRRIRTLAIVDNIDTLGGAAWLGAFILAFVVEVLHKDVSWWGFMNTVFFIGSIAGGVFIVARVKKIQKNSYLFMLFGLSVYVGITFFFAFNTIPVLALILLAISGIPVQIASIIRHTLIQQNLTPAETPSAMSALSVLSNFTFAIAMLLLSWIADRYGMRDMYVVAGVMTTAAVVIGFVYRSAFREELSPAYASEENVVVNKV